VDAATNQMQIEVWYILAGIVVGFAASTLWEWLYFRGRRLAVKERDPYDLTSTGKVSTTSSLTDTPIDETPVPSGARMDIEHPGALAVATTAQQPWSPVAPSRTPSPVAAVAAPSRPDHLRRRMSRVRAATPMI
jgi:hypothetical protein